MRNSLVSVKRTFNYSYWQPSTATTSDFWKYYSFTLADLPSVAEFTGVFEQYRINAIKVTFRPRFDGFSGENTTDVTLPGITNQAGQLLHIVKDQRTTTIPSGLYTRANLNAFLENGSVKTYRGTRAINVYFKPAVTRTTVSSASSTFDWAPWIQTSVTNANHFGFHAFAQDPNLTGTFGQAWDVFVTFYMQFKGLR